MDTSRGFRGKKQKKNRRKPREARRGVVKSREKLSNDATALEMQTVFCQALGLPFDGQEVAIQGLRIESSYLPAEACNEDIWDGFRSRLMQAQVSGIKEELDCSDDEGNMLEGHILEVLLDDVFPSQLSCGRKFSCGRSLPALIDDLRSHRCDPLRDDFLVLKVIMATVKYHRRGRVFFALDHRRWHCMHEAGCARITVQVVLQHRFLDNFIVKAWERLTSLPMHVRRSR